MESVIELPDPRLHVFLTIRWLSPHLIYGYSHPEGPHPAESIHPGQFDINQTQLSSPTFSFAVSGIVRSASDI